ncbi:alpha/beta fold hydrolase [Pseudonocardia aurantiaca]|uniref:Alpha/beta fold hydrolase n=1 Tax=Pseudonocardia aurantiaca TaxID=75290 RepID=A0ABW4FJQ1_9PSEU
MADRLEHVEGRLTGVRDVELFWQAWLPPEPPTGVLLLCHGLGEHSGRYGHVVDALVPAGWAVYGLDLRGHGRSEGKRCHLVDYADWLADFDAFRRLAAARHDGLPVFLLGHSMGGRSRWPTRSTTRTTCAGSCCRRPRWRTAPCPPRSSRCSCRSPGSPRRSARRASTRPRSARTPRCTRPTRPTRWYTTATRRWGCLRRCSGSSACCRSGRGSFGCRCSCSTASWTRSPTSPASARWRRRADHRTSPCSGTRGSGTRSTRSRSATDHSPTCGSGSPRTAERVLSQPGVLTLMPVPPPGA